jgi:hypothetical protein
MIVTERIARKFDAVLAAEQNVREQMSLAGFGVDAATRARGERNLPDAKDGLSEALAQLTTDELTEFGVYRMRVAR